MSTTNTDQGFKLLAIRPLEGCDSKYSKNLELGRTYQFYKDYTITPEIDLDGTKPVSISHKQSVPESMYNITTVNGNSINVNISAVVGKNGSGKSTLLELLYATTYIIGEELNQFDEEGLKEAKLELEAAESMLSKHKENPLQTIEEWSKDAIETIRMILNDTNIESDKNRFDQIQNMINESILKPEDYEQSRLSWKKVVDSLEHTLDKLRLQIYFRLKRRYYILQINSLNNKRLSLGFIDESGEILPITETKILKNLFYSIVINYSIYGLNNKIVGEWVNPLFHKNDGYQTPIVINPMRNNGNYRIGREAYLAKHRFASNLLTNTKIKSNGVKFSGQEVKYFLFKLNHEKPIKIRFTRNAEGYFGKQWVDSLGYQIQESLYKQFEIDESLLLMNTLPFQEKVENYIINKVEKILWVYNQYRLKYTSATAVKREYIFETVLLNKINEFVEELYYDDSHITFKLKQAINYLKYPSLLSNNKVKNKINFNDQEITLENWDSNNFVISVNELAKKTRANQSIENGLIRTKNRLNDRKVKNFELSVINFIPPSIFDLEILFASKDSKLYSFQRLSSGELQLIHSVQTIIYHITNLNSVFKQNTANSNTLERVSYSAMNVILDEIELYFHPDYQRQFISFLIDSIKELKIGGRKGVNSINILLATHSPFILSDIPSQNVLRLKDGKPYEEPQKGTFGANVHDLLHDSFFMEDGFMGKFAEEKINEVIKRINYEKQTLEIDRLYKLISSTETAISDKESLTKEKRKLEARRSDLYLDKPELSIDSCISLVEMIGEPAIQNKLCSMISTIKSQNENIAYLNEIQEIKKKYGKL